MGVKHTTCIVSKRFFDIKYSLMVNTIFWFKPAGIALTTPVPCQAVAMTAARRFDAQRL
jgi:hypothetical protein